MGIQRLRELKDALDNPPRSRWTNLAEGEQKESMDIIIRYFIFQEESHSEEYQGIIPDEQNEQKENKEVKQEDIQKTIYEYGCDELRTHLQQLLTGYLDCVDQRSLTEENENSIKDILNINRKSHILALAMKLNFHQEIVLAILDMYSQVFPGEKDSMIRSLFSSNQNFAATIFGYLVDFKDENSFKDDFIIVNIIGNYSEWILPYFSTNSVYFDTTNPHSTLITTLLLDEHTRVLAIKASEESSCSRWCQFFTRTYSAKKQWEAASRLQTTHPKSTENLVNLEKAHPALKSDVLCEIMNAYQRMAIQWHSSPEP